MAERTTAIQVEPTEPPGVVAERVFLTPRVVDQAAFDDYATRLRRLLEQVAGAAQTMAHAAVEAGTTHKGLLDASGQQRATLEVTTKLLKALNAKAGEVEAMVVSLEQRVRAAQELEERAASHAEKVASQMEDRIRARIESSVREAERAASLQRVDVERLEALVARAEAVIGSVESASDRLESVRQRAEHAVSVLETGLNAANDAYESLLEQQDMIDQGLEVAIQASERLSEQLGGEGERVREMFAPLLEAQEQADKVGGRLAARIEESRLLNDASRDTLAQLRALLGSAERAAQALEPWRSVLLGGGRGEALPPALVEIVDRFRGEIGSDLAKMAAAMNLIAQRAQTSLRPPSVPGSMPELLIRPKPPEAGTVGPIHAEPKSSALLPSSMLDTGSGAD